jgi:hypothetical protein
MLETTMLGVHHQYEDRDWNYIKKAVHIVEDSG